MKSFAALLGPVLLISGLLGAASAQEAIVIGTPITFPTPPSISEYRPDSVLFQLHPVPKIGVILHAVNQPSQTVYVEYPRDCQVAGTSAGCLGKDTAQEVADMIKALASLNLSVTNLWTRLHTHLCADFPLVFPNCSAK